MQNLIEDGNYMSEKRTFWNALFFEKDDDLNLTFFFLALYSFVGMAAVIKTVIMGDAAVVVQIASLAFLGSAFMGLLIAAIPYAKAKILARSSLPSDVAASISGLGTSGFRVRNDESSLDSDIQEEYLKNNNKPEIG
jgi:hypothetical protein